MKKTFYISTPIYYPSGKPHIGHAYSTILADVISKYKQLIGYETFYITGTDEHGKKIQEKANELNMSPKEYVDMNSKIFIDLWKRLKIDYSKFVRTTDISHTETVKKVFQIFKDKELIYLNEWKGLYCVSCEENFNHKQAKKENDDYFCTLNHKLIDIKEPSYFFKMKNFTNWVNELFQKTPDLIYPKSRMNELTNNFINTGIDDLSITRTSFDWGIEIEPKSEHIIYVWLDALLSYISGLGYLSDDSSLFEKYWNHKDAEIVHILSKEITRFHCIYWPIFLDNLNIKLPTKIISHGWIVTKEGKMSKSLGNVIDPNLLIDEFGVDAIRYYFMSCFAINSENVFITDSLVANFNGDLANNFGNLVSRFIGLIKKYNNKKIPEINKDNLSDYAKKALNEIEIANKNIIENINKLDVLNICKEVMRVINYINKYIEDIKPWELFKNNEKNELDSLIIIIAKTIQISNFWLSPILSEGKDEVILQTNIPLLKMDEINELHPLFNITVNDSKPIYKRIENKD